jgi:hypothetical protein
MVRRPQRSCGCVYQNHEIGEICMRAILATMKPVLHVPLGIAATAVAMVASIAIAVSSPYPKPEPRWMMVEAMPKIVVESISIKLPDQPVIDHFSPAIEEQPRQVHPVTDIPEAKAIDAVAEAKAYLAETAHPGGTMTVLGREKAIECFHPQFALNLAATIRDARENGLPDAAVSSGCRPPRLGVGGFADKKSSLHGVGLAADIDGIGRPCSADAKRFHKIAAAHGVFGAYGPCNRAEWNHVQGTEIKMTTPSLRATFTPKGEICPDLKKLWSIASSIVLAVAKPITALVESAESHHSSKRKRSAKRHRGKHRKVADQHRRRHHSHHRTAKRHRASRVANAD